MLAGAAELGLVRGKLRNRVWRLCRAARVRGLRRRVPDPRAERLAASRALGVRAPRLRLDGCWSARSSRSVAAFRPRSRVWGAGLRADARRARRRSLRRPRRGADLRAPLADRRGGAPVRRAARRRRCVALALPGGGLGARDARARRRPQYGAAARAARRRVVRLDVRPERRRAARTRSGSTTRRAGSSRGRTRPGARPADVDAPVPRLPRGGYTVRWRAISADGHVGLGVFTFGVRQQAPAMRRRRSARPGPTTREHVVRWLYFLALALLTGGLGFRLLVAARAGSAEAAQRRFYQLLAVAGAIGVLEVGIVAFLLRAEDALQLPFVDFLYGDLSPLAKTRFGTAFVAMTLGFALVARAPLPRLADRARACCSGRPSCSRSGSRRASRSPATRRPTPARRGSPSSRTGCTCRRRRSGSAGSCSSRSWSGRSSRSCAAAPSCASRASPRC